MKKPKKAKVFVNHDPGDTAVYIRKPDGYYVAVYVGEYSNGYSINENLDPFVAENGSEKVWPK